MFGASGVPRSQRTQTHSPHTAAVHSLPLSCGLQGSWVLGVTLMHGGSRLGWEPLWAHGGERFFGWERHFPTPYAVSMMYVRCTYDAKGDLPFLGGASDAVRALRGYQAQPGLWPRLTCQVHWGRTQYPYALLEPVSSAHMQILDAARAPCKYSLLGYGTTPLAPHQDWPLHTRRQVASAPVDAQTHSVVAWKCNPGDPAQDWRLSKSHSVISQGLVLAPAHGCLDWRAGTAGAPLPVPFPRLPIARSRTATPATLCLQLPPPPRPQGAHLAHHAYKFFCRGFSGSCGVSGPLAWCLVFCVGFAARSFRNAPAGHFRPFEPGFAGR